MISPQNISEAKQRIVNLVRDQVAAGAQTEALGSSEVVACGQFFGENATDKRQRGIHGTSAALQILRDGSPDLALKLALYLCRRDTLERQLALPDGSVVFPLDDEKLNTIKVCELLLAVLSIDYSNNQELVSFVSEKRKALEAGSQSHNSWAYFFDSGGQEEELLPTIFVLPVFHALNAKAEENRVKEYLFRKISEAQKNWGSPSSDDFTLIFCIYTLIFTETDLTDSQHKELRQLVRILWLRYSFLLTNDIEQNVEYWKGSDKSYYIRVPWQLYLLALTARLSPKSFASGNAQQALSRIVEKARSSVFTYNHSNVLPSTRTNFILFRTLSDIEKYYRRGFRFYLLYGVDRSFEFVTRRWIRLLACSALALYFLIRFAIPWFQSRDASNQFGGDIVSTIVSGTFVFLLTYRRRT